MGRLGVSALLVAGLMAGPLVAEDGPPKQTIQNQITAFESGDLDQAFEYASPMIQGMFPSAEAFGQMVQSGYPMVLQPDAVTFLDDKAAGIARLQTVMIRDGQGALHFLEYQMVKIEGDWRINGVRFLPPPGAGA